MQRVSAFWVAVALLFATAVAAISQQPNQPAIRANVSVVLAPVTVTDKKGKFVDGLGAGEFALYDDARPQRIEVDYSETLAPISLVVAVQTSDIAAPVLAKFTKVGSLIQPLVTGQGGEAALVTFDDEVLVAQDFTSDPVAIVDAFRALKARDSRAGRTVDALAESVRMLAARPGNRRRVLVIVCESRDRGSKADLWETLASAQREGVAVYPATFSAQKSAWTVKAGELQPPGGGGLIAVFIELSRMGKKNAADAMSRATGGEHLSFTTLRGLERVIAGIGEELHSQYLLSFPQASSDGRYHEVQVRLPKHPEFLVRCRPGYWANSVGPGATINLNSR
jgi:VWFA-related protein